MTALITALLSAAASAHPHPDPSGCAAVGTWLDPATAEALATDRLLAGLAQRPIVLLGEAHDNAEHHRWQLYTLAALHGLKPDMILGFESFPRRVQPILDQWVNGELDAVAFLEAVDWQEIWGFDPALYLPLFDFARLNRVPMIALNVDRDLVSRVKREGWEAVPADERAGLSDPAAASAAYRESLAGVYTVEQLHAAKNPESGDPHAAVSGADAAVDDVDAPEIDAPAVESFAVEIEAPAVESFAVEIEAPAVEAFAVEVEAPAIESFAVEVEAPAVEVEASAGEEDAPTNGVGAVDSPADEAHAPAVDIGAVIESEDFARFVAAQLTWDRAMAEALAAARRRQPGSLVVGVMGRGHVEHGYGVPHQLIDLGIPGAAVLLPVERAASCDGLPADLADAVFVIDEPTPIIATAPPKARLGVMLKMTDDGVQIANVMEGSVAEAIALQANDIVVAAAGFPIAQLSDLIEIVQRQAPGTWLPLSIRREAENLEFVAKFPTHFDSPE